MYFGPANSAALRRWGNSVRLGTGVRIDRERPDTKARPRHRHADCRPIERRQSRSPEQPVGAPRKSVAAASDSNFGPFRIRSATGYLHIGQGHANYAQGC